MTHAKWSMRDQMDSLVKKICDQGVNTKVNHKLYKVIRKNFKTLKILKKKTLYLDKKGGP